ncbi:MAG: hypothetical protein IJ808_00790 [Muribaculaceae bacterium]|nr:hypothetical protein [Muribaculaceae bacterium]
MKRSEDDKKLAALLKEECAQPLPGQNPWFTPRVLNRLPERSHSRYFLAIAWLLAVAGCVLTWIVVATDFTATVITLRDLLQWVIMAAISVGVFLQPLVRLMRQD